MKKFMVTAGDSKETSFLVNILEEKPAAIRAAVDLKKHYKYVAVDGKPFMQ